MSATDPDSYTLFSQRSDFSDLVPIPQPDAPNCLVPIAYTEKYRDAMDIFRALVAKGEKSERALQVTEVLIRLNPGHYSIWAYRAQTLLDTQSDLTKELDLMDELMKEHLKSYQVWFVSPRFDPPALSADPSPLATSARQHRRTIVLALSSPTRELPFTSKALSYDAKNYHTWAYRQWVLLHFYSIAPSASSKENATKKEVWEGELRYTESLLEDDLRNNSAWNHRFFCCFESGMIFAGEGGEEGGKGKEAVRDREIEFTKEKLNLSPNNPSAWNYLRGLLKATSTPLTSSTLSLTSFVTPLTESHPIPPSITAKVSPVADLPSVLAIEFLADLKVEEGDRVGAGKLFESLEEYDPIRSHYWKYKVKQMEKVKSGASVA